MPHDIIYPHVPRVLQRFAAEYPRVKLQLHSLYTSGLKEQLARGEMDLILTTEAGVDAGGETLSREPLVWAGAPGGQAWRQRPLRFASCGHCVFKRPALEALEAAGIALGARGRFDLDGGGGRQRGGRPRGQRADGERGAAHAASRSATAARCRRCRSTGSTCTWRRGRARRWPSGWRACVRQAYGVADCLAAE